MRSPGFDKRCPKQRLDAPLAGRPKGESGGGNAARIHPSFSAKHDRARVSGLCCVWGEGCAMRSPGFDKRRPRKQRLDAPGVLPQAGRPKGESGEQILTKNGRLKAAPVWRLNFT